MAPQCLSRARLHIAATKIARRRRSAVHHDHQEVTPGYQGETGSRLERVGVLVEGPLEDVVEQVTSSAGDLQQHPALLFDIAFRERRADEVRITQREGGERKRRVEHVVLLSEQSRQPLPDRSMPQSIRGAHPYSTIAE